MSEAASAYARSSLSCATLRDLDARRQAQLVAGDVRAGDLADHARLDAEVPERLDQLRGDLLLARGVGPRRLLGRALEEAVVRHGPLEVRRLGDLGAVAALRRELLRVDRRPRDARLVRLGVLRRAVGSLRRPAPARARAPARRPRWPARRRDPDSGPRRTRTILGLRRGPRDPRLARLQRRPAPRSGAARERMSRVVDDIDVVVAFTTPAIDAPVSSSTAARNRNTATMCAPIAPSAVETPQYRPSPITPPRGRTQSASQCTAVPPGPEAERPGRQRRARARRTGTAPPARNGRTAGSTGRSTRIAPPATNATGST